MNRSKRIRITSWNRTALGILIAITMGFAGCAKSSLRDIPFLRLSKAEASFDEIAQSDSTSLAIWHESFEEAQVISRETGKPILADFTGSDWCSWCIRLKKDVFETDEFKSWAKDNVVLLELDYPKRAIQSPKIRKQNEALKERYSISGYPTVLFLDGDGAVLGKLGYLSTAAQWIESAESKLAD